MLTQPSEPHRFVGSAALALFTATATKFAAVAEGRGEIISVIIFVIHDAP
jgi:hypothetical protein